MAPVDKVLVNDGAMSTTDSSSSSSTNTSTTTTTITTARVAAERSNALIIRGDWAARLRMLWIKCFGRRERRK